MPDLRERFDALDALEVPDVLSRARSIGPLPPDPERTPLSQRVATYAVAAVIAIVAVIVIVRAIDRSGVPAHEPTPTPSEADSVQRRGSEFLWYSGDALTERPGELVAIDPATGTSRAIVDPDLTGSLTNAAWSADGRWVAFDFRWCSPQDPHAGLWVSDAVGAEERIFGYPCDRDRSLGPPLWAWSPDPLEPRIAIGPGTEWGDHLIVLDPAIGGARDLGPVEGDLDTLVWSPDGRTITYNGDRSIYSVDVATGTTSVIAEDLGDVSGIGGSGIHWSPTGDELAIAVDADAGPTELSLMNADGSGLRAIEDHVQDVAWSPDGSRLAFATFTGLRNERVLRIWTLEPDTGDRVLLDEERSFTTYETTDLAWSPDGTDIAFTTDTADGDLVHRAVVADGSGDVRDLDELEHLAWRNAPWFCRCFG